MIDRELSYTERNQIDTARTAARALGISWERVVEAFRWSQDGKQLAECRAADRAFHDTDWSLFTDWTPTSAKKGDYLWFPGYGIVRVVTSGTKQASIITDFDHKVTLSPEYLSWGLPIPESKVAAAKALLTGFFLGYRAAGREVYSINTVGAFQLRRGLQDLLGVSR